MVISLYNPEIYSGAPAEPVLRLEAIKQQSLKNLINKQFMIKNREGGLCQ
jgi:hypothetical protein